LTYAKIHILILTFCYFVLSQKKIYEIIKELGGTATPTEIKKLVRIKYPDASLHDYVYYMLQNLKRWDIIKKNADGSWTIINELE